MAMLYVCHPLVAQRKRRTYFSLRVPLPGFLHVIVTVYERKVRENGRLSAYVPLPIKQEYFLSPAFAVPFSALVPAPRLSSLPLILLLISHA